MADHSQLRVTEADLEQARERLLAHQEEDEAEDNGYGYYHPVGASSPNYGAVPPAPSQPMRRKRPRVRESRKKRYRIPFLVLLLFDCGLIIFLSIICSEKPLSDDEAKWSTSEYFNFDVKKTYFDLVFLAIVRLVLNVLFYIIMEWITRLIMGLTLLLSAFYVPVKAFYVWRQLDDDHLDQSIAILLILFVAFVMPWFIAFFFEFKYLPAELSRVYVETWWDWRAWLWPRALARPEEERLETPSLPDVATLHPPRGFARTPTRPFSSSNLSLDFRTPLGSSRGSPVPADYERPAEEDLPAIIEESSSREETLSAEDLRFKREGEQALQSLMEVGNIQTGWNVDKMAGNVKCYARPGKGRKIFKGEVVIEMKIHHLWGLLYPGDQMPEWSVQCAINEVVYRVDDNTDILYTATNQVGPVSSRDFVSARRIAVRDGVYYAASVGTVTDMKPVQPGRVRGQNGPCGYILVPVDSNCTKLVWIINSDLKGWLPQAVIDQNVSGTVVSSLQKLQEYIHRQRAEGILQV